MSGQPVVVNKTSYHDDIVERLKKKGFRIRWSDNVIRYSYIYPQSGVAFIIINSVSKEFCQQDLQLQLPEKVVSSLQSFAKGHRLSYALIVSASCGNDDLAILMAIQRQNLDNGLQCILLTSIDDCVQVMTSIAQAAHKDSENVLMQNVEMSRDAEVVSDVLKHLHISDHESQMLVDGLGSLLQISAATASQLSDCSVDTLTAHNIQLFFHDHHAHHGL